MMSLAEFVLLLPVIVCFIVSYSFDLLMNLVICNERHEIVDHTNEKQEQLVLTF